MSSNRLDGPASLQMIAAPPIEVQTVKFKRACVLACSSLKLQIKVMSVQFTRKYQRTAHLHRKDVLRARVGENLDRDRLDERGSEPEQVDVARRRESLVADKKVVHDDENEVADRAEGDVRGHFKAVEAAEERERAKEGHRGEDPESSVEQDRI
jgi:hypothetical protein